jgi:hypothetical protein
MKLLRRRSSVFSLCLEWHRFRLQSGTHFRLIPKKSEPACFDKTTCLLVNYKRSRSSRAALPGSKESGVC